MAGPEFFTIDVFADRPFQGAPIAVFPDAAAIPAALLPAIAGELNLSETVFLYPGVSADRFGVRVFDSTFAGFDDFLVLDLEQEAGGNSRAGRSPHRGRRAASAS